MRFRLVLTCVSVFVAVMLTTVPVAIAPENDGLANASMDNAIVAQQMAAMPLAFTENRGQWDERVRFRASAGGTTLWFCRDGITYQFTHRVPRSKTAGTEPLAAGVAPRAPFDRAEQFMPSEAEAPVASAVEPDSTETVVIHAAFAGGNPEVELAGENLLKYRCNYFLGNDPSKWRTDVPNYTAVVYRNVYPGVDVRYEGKGGALTCSFTAASESDLAQVKFRYSGDASVTETGLGQFRVEAPWGTDLEPVSSLQSSGSAGSAPFGTASALARTGTGFLSLVYSTYLGGTDADLGYGIAVDDAGSAYVTGETGSTDYPTADPYQAYQGNGDVVVTKLNAAGNGLVYSTYLGGSDEDYGNSIAVDGNGNAYVTGVTFSTNFPTAGPCQTDQGGRDAFVTKLGAAGNTLVYSTYLGGSGDDIGYGIAVDKTGFGYVTGWTYSIDFPTVAPYQTDQGGPDAFVTKLSAIGSTLVYSTYLGGGGTDGGYSIAVDQGGCAYVTGKTSSSDFPAVGPYQAYQGSLDAFVSKLSAAGNGLIYSTYIGGGDYDDGQSIAVDKTGSAYITGLTSSTDFPTVGPFQSILRGTDDAFVTKLSAAGSVLVYSTYLGGNGTDLGDGIAVDARGNAYVSGTTYSTDFPTADPYQTDQDSADVFVTRLDATGAALVYSSYLGGHRHDGGGVIAIDELGNAWVTGGTRSEDFPTQDPFDPSINGGYWDAFVAKFFVCNCPNQGNVNGDAVIDVFDVVDLIDIAFSGGADPQDPICPNTRGDVDNNGVTDVFDVIYLIATAFSGGAEPVNPCGP